MRTHTIPSCYRKVKEILIMPPDLTLLSTLSGSNYPCLELNFMVPKVFETLKFDCIRPKRLVQSCIILAPSISSMIYILNLCSILLENGCFDQATFKLRIGIPPVQISSHISMTFSIAFLVSKPVHYFADMR